MLKCVNHVKILKSFYKKVYNNNKKKNYNLGQVIAFVINET